MNNSTIQLSRNKINLAMARKLYNISDLAVACKVSRQRMSLILGSKQVTTVSAGKIARALDVDVTDIID